MMTSKPDQPLFEDAVLRVDQIPVAGRELRVNADQDQLEALTKLMKVSSVDAFSAQLRAEKFRGGLHVTGELQARVTQPCVVSFEPVGQEIAEPVDRVFLPGHDRAYDSPPGSETFVDLEADDIPDHFEGTYLDLTPLLTEILGLAIDLYPRAPGAELPAEADDGPDEEPNPFAALKQLHDPDKDPH